MKKSELNHCVTRNGDRSDPSGVKSFDKTSLNPSFAAPLGGQGRKAEGDLQEHHDILHGIAQEEPRATMDELSAEFQGRSGTSVCARRRLR